MKGKADSSIDGLSAPKLSQAILYVPHQMDLDALRSSRPLPSALVLFVQFVSIIGAQIDGGRLLQL